MEPPTDQIGLFVYNYLPNDMILSSSHNDTEGLFSQLDLLPNELITLIGEQLDTLSLHRFRLTCKLYYDILLSVANQKYPQPTVLLVELRPQEERLPRNDTYHFNVKIFPNCHSEDPYFDEIRSLTRIVPLTESHPEVLTHYLGVEISYLLGTIWRWPGNEPPPVSYGRVVPKEFFPVPDVTGQSISLASSDHSVRLVLFCDEEGYFWPIEFMYYNFGSHRTRSSINGPGYGWTMGTISGNGPFRIRTRSHYFLSPEQTTNLLDQQAASSNEIEFDNGRVTDQFGGLEGPERDRRDRVNCRQRSSRVYVSLSDQIPRNNLITRNTFGRGEVREHHIHAGATLLHPIS